MLFRSLHEASRLADLIHANRLLTRLSDNLHDVTVRPLLVRSATRAGSAGLNAATTRAEQPCGQQLAKQRGLVPIVRDNQIGMSSLALMGRRGPLIESPF